MAKDSRPIFIIGSPRSGTTLLGKLLSAHPELAYTVEPRLVWRRGNDGASDALTPEHARPDVAKSIRAHFNKFVTTNGKQRLLEKTPSNALRLDFMRKIYPDGIFIHVTRNAYDAVLSISSYSSKHATGLPPRGVLLRRLKEVRPSQLPHYARELSGRLLPKWLNIFGTRPAWGPRLPGMGGLQDELGSLAVSALQWRCCVESACQAGRAFPEDQYMEFRLEDFDEELLRRIMSFCGLPESPEVIAAFRENFRPADPTGRHAQADPEQLETIRRWTEPTLAWLGYASNPPKPHGEKP